MKRFLPFLWCGIAALMLAVAGACSDDKTNLGPGSGTIDITIEVDGSVIPTNGVSVSPTTVALPDPSDFEIIITDSEGHSSPWTGVSSVGAQERLLPGTYSLLAVSGSVGAEGFDLPCFIGQSSVVVENGMATQASITASLSNILVDVVFDRSAIEMFPSISAILHSGNGIYLPYKPADTAPLFLSQGMLSVYLSLDNDGKSNFAILSDIDTHAATYYRVYIEAGEDADGVASISARCSGGEQNRVRLTPEFLAGNGPVIEAPSFRSGATITVKEGGTAAEPLIASVSSSNLSHLYFSITAPTLGSAFTSQVDLVNIAPTQTDSMTRFGIIVKDIHKGEVKNGTVDFSKTVSYLRYFPGAIPSKFSLIAVDADGRASEAATLSVGVVPVELVVESVSKAVIGIDKAEMILTSSSADLSGNILIQSYNYNTDKWIDLPIDSIRAAGTSRWSLTFTVPEGRSDITCRMLFCGTETSRFIVGRIAPQYTFEVDPFALHANIRIDAEDPSMTRIIASNIQFYKASKTGKAPELIQMIERHPDYGYVTISGLEASSSYRIYSSLLADPSPLSDDFSQPVDFRTEAAAQIPNGDFEDVKFGSIKYANMLSGGRYSQNTVEIYNLQNRTSFDLMTPERWATVNDKTFCRAASNHNTWYLAPSTYTVEDASSGSYAVRLDCVGYDIHGAPIPDYLQTAPPYTPYSRSIPSGYSHAAGRLFLGSYSFDAASGRELYTEGISFASRPVAVNGFYKFVATSANPRATALARVQIIGSPDGVDIVIAEGELHLPVALSYTAFTIPLSYDRFGTKATSIRIMFAPSEAIGDIEAETQSIIVIPDPATSTLRGSSLWLDNLSLSY